MVQSDFCPNLYTSLYVDSCFAEIYNPPPSARYQKRGVLMPQKICEPEKIFTAGYILYAKKQGTGA